MTKTTEKTFLFDPGYAQHTTILSINIDYMYSKIGQYKNIGQRRTQFKMFYPNILKMVESNIGFCLGSLLWAAYIKSESDNATIEGNPCLGSTYDEAEAIEEIDFSVEYFTRLKKDVKYYLGSDYEINPLYIKILNLYKEFLTQNKGFTETRTTSDLQIPSELNIPTKEDAKTIYDKIQNVITNGNLIELTEVLGLIYKG